MIHLLLSRSRAGWKRAFPSRLSPSFISSSLSVDAEVIDVLKTRYIVYVCMYQAAANGGLEEGEVPTAPSSTTNSNSSSSTTKAAPAAPKSPEKKVMRFPVQAAKAKAAAAAAGAGGVPPPPTTDSWDNEPVAVSVVAFR